MSIRVRNAVKQSRLVAVLALLLFSSIFAQKASAAAIEIVGSGSKGSCTDAALIAAIAAVDPGGTILFDCGSDAFVISVSTQVIDKAVTVNGGNRITLDGGGTLQPFYVMPSGDLTLLNIQITHGDFTSGGAIFNTGKTTLSNVVLDKNTASSGSGAGIYNRGTLVVENSIISNNTAWDSGGGIYSESGSVVLVNSELNNNAAGLGGGIAVAGGTAEIYSTLFIGNGYASANTGGGIYNLGSLLLTNNTFAGNYAISGGGLYNAGTTASENNTFHINHADLGGAIFNDFGTIFTRNTIFSSSLSLDGTYASLNCDGPTITTQGGNISSDNSCGPVDATDQPATDPMLASLQNNGGRALTHRPLSGSPAIDAGIAGCPSVDARGFSRPTGAACDVGAVEYGFWLFLPVQNR